jgi:hypothetical protein
MILRVDWHNCVVLNANTSLKKVKSRDGAAFRQDSNRRSNSHFDHFRQCASRTGPEA